MREVYASAMFNKGKLVGVAVAVLVLSGCSAAAVDEAVGGAAAEVVASAEATVEPAAAPLAVEPDAPTDAPTPAVTGMAKEGEVTFISSVRSRLYGLETVTDEQLLAAGWYTCEQLDAGAKRSTLIALSGESGSEPVPGMNNASVMFGAIENLCVEYNSTDSF